MSRSKADALLVFNTVIWGTTFVVVKTALQDISPVLFLALRFSLAAVLLLILFRGTGREPWTWKQAAAGSLAGTFLFSGYVLQTVGLRFTTAPKSAFLTGMTSVLVPFLAALVYKSRPQVSEVLGVAVATAGLALMTFERTSGVIGPIGRGDFLTLFCALGFAAHIVTLSRFSGQMSFEFLSVMQIGAAAVLACSSFWWAEHPHVVWRPAVVSAILITGVFATALTFTIQAWVQPYTTSTRTALIYMLEPVFAWITSYWVAGEGLASRAAVGAALILGGVFLVEVKPLNARLHPFR